MEKLQNALKKAREMRDAPAPGTAAAAAGAAAAAAAPGGAVTPATGLQGAAAAPSAASSAAAAPSPAPAVPAPVPGTALQGAAETALARADARDRAWKALRPFEPDPALLTRNRIVTLRAGTGTMHFDILRTKVFLMMQRNGWTRLAVTSPTKACGKTTTACNLAAGFSRQPDLHVMLIEMDLRRPTVAAQLGFEPARDVASMLSGQVPFAEQAVRLRDNVAIAAARRASHDPAAIMLSRRTLETLEGIEASYAPDLVIFDLPPLMGADDTHAFLKNVDCALLVVKAETSTVRQIDACEREISEQTNMLGVVLNQCRHADRETGYDSYYGADSAGQA